MRLGLGTSIVTCSVEGCDYRNEIPGATVEQQREMRLLGVQHMIDDHADEPDFDEFLTEGIEHCSMRMAAARTLIAHEGDVMFKMIQAQKARREKQATEEVQKHG